MTGARGVPVLVAAFVAALVAALAPGAAPAAWRPAPPRSSLPALRPAEGVPAPLERDRDRDRIVHLQDSLRAIIQGARACASG